MFSALPIIRDRRGGPWMEKNPSGEPDGQG
jgi:hypothetical protein